MAEERKAREQDSRVNSTMVRTPDNMFIEGLESAQQQEQQLTSKKVKSLSIKPTLNLGLWLFR